LLELRDRAILKFYLYTGARIETGCALNVSDFHQDGDEATLRFHIKGNRYKTKGIHFSAAERLPSTSRRPESRAVPSSAPAVLLAATSWRPGG
jgi:site-specific recombinase XerD